MIFVKNLEIFNEKLFKFSNLLMDSAMKLADFSLNLLLEPKNININIIFYTLTCKSSKQSPSNFSN